MKKLYYNGNIVTMAKEGEYVEALLAETKRLGVGSIATISFPEFGVKRLDLIVCLKRGQIALAHFLPDSGR